MKLVVLMDVFCVLFEKMIKTEMIDVFFLLAIEIGVYAFTPELSMVDSRKKRTMQASRYTC